MKVMKKPELEALGVGFHNCGRCLYLQATKKKGSDTIWRSWIYLYLFAGQRTYLGLGSLEEVSHKQALALASDARTLLLQGIDPKADRQAKVDAAKAKHAARITFAAAMEAYLEFHGDKWRGGGSEKQWRSSLTRFALPKIGDLGVADIGVAHIQNVLLPIWKKIPPTASRVRNRIEAILNWATANGSRAGENPARWEGHLAELFPSPKQIAKVKHLAAVPYDEVPSFVRKLDNSIAGRALAFTVLTACRTKEVRLATWDEIDLTKKLWVIPGDRTKSGREHRVPLSGAAVDLLRKLPRLGEFVFPGTTGDRPMNHGAMLRVLPEKTTVHGLRSSFRDWCGDRTNYPREIMEAALGHKVGEATETSYRRGDALEKRRRMMEEWSRFLSSEPVADSEVVALHG
jgi:integrase